MKFRILRDYDEFQPQVWYNDHVWVNIGKYACYTIEEAERVCAGYKQMKDNEVVEEFEL